MTLTKSDRDIIVAHNIGKAYQAIEDAEILLNNNSFAGSLNRIYYGVFFIISALAIKKEYKTSKHSQLIGWFNKNYVRNFKISRDIGRFIHIAFELRLESDYDPLAVFTFDEVAKNLEKMKEAIETIKKLIEKE